MTNNEVKKLVEDTVKAAVDEAIKPLDNALANAILGLQVAQAEYHNVAELPAWAQPAVTRLKEAGIITGDGKHEINLTDKDLVTAAMVDKLWLAIVGNEA